MLNSLELFVQNTNMAAKTFLMLLIVTGHLHFPVQEGVALFIYFIIIILRKCVALFICQKVEEIFSKKNKKWKHGT